MRYRFIQAEKANYPVVILCRCLRVTKSGFYAWLLLGKSVREKENEELTARIVKIHQESHATYGALRVTAVLKKAGMVVGHNRVARLLKQAGICVKPRRRFVKTTDSGHGLPVAPNRLQRKFQQESKDRAWVTDITYLFTEQGVLYLAVVLDLFSRKVVGFATRPKIDRNLVLAALFQALRNRKPDAGLLHHSDQGSQYASVDYQTALLDAKVSCSMSRKGNCYDNAVVESFFATLKGELIYRTKWISHRQVEMALFEYIEGFYNRKRLHSFLDYQSPLEYEQKNS